METPEGPWETLTVDFKGPIGGQHGWYFHTVMDLYCQYPVTRLVNITAMENLVDILDPIWDNFGTPNLVWSDGGAPYNGHKWEDYAQHWGFNVEKTTLEHPPANGMVERFNRNLKKYIYAALAEGKNPKNEVGKYLTTYRRTPHATMEETHNKLMYGRELKGSMPVPCQAPRGRTTTTPR